MAGKGRHRGRAGRAVLGGRARASGLSRALSRRLHLPLRPPELEAAATGSASRPLSCWKPEPDRVTRAPGARGPNTHKKEPRSAVALEQILVGDRAHDAPGDADHDRAGGDVARDHRSGGDERLLADL